MATRHQARAAVVSLLYSREFDDNKDFIEEYLEEKKIRNDVKAWALGLYDGIIENLDKIDATLNEVMDDDGFCNVASVEKGILRLGVYEMLFTNLDNPIIINEAIELAKELGALSAPKLINGVLDNINKKSS